MIWTLLWLQQIFAVGDAGALSKRQVRLYKQFWIDHAKKGDILLWLGDNLYPSGHRGRPRDKRRWERLVSVSRAFPGQVIAIPGNHDWKAGIHGLLRQEKDLLHLPRVGSLAPETLSIGRWHFFFIDSELYIQSQGRDFPWKRMDSLLQSFHPKDTIIIVLHHPPKTVGAHGGYFPLSAHLFPLRILSPYLYLPLPGLGTLLVFLRKAYAHPSDQHHPAYADLAQNLLKRALSLTQPVLFLSGHDHNLQIHRLQENKYAIVSGSGCKTEPLARRKALWGKAVVGLWKITPTAMEAYNLRHSDMPIWKYGESVVP
ncbi:MAG: metallophosphoesterase [Bacteroidia bacterium]|nr:metallophosphoesterase [Bacteroidia bacterium]